MSKPFDTEQDDPDAPAPDQPGVAVPGKTMPAVDDPPDPKAKPQPTS